MNARKLRVLALTAGLLPFDFVVAAALLLTQAACIPLLMTRSRSRSSKPVDTCSVTIQVLNWDGRALLDEFLPSVVAAARGHNLVVVDNGSTDGSQEFLKQRFPSVTVVELDKNYGFSIGNNLGAQKTKSDVIVFLNNDMAVDPAFLGPLLAPFSDPSVFAVASRIEVPDPAKASHETGKTRARFERGFFDLRHDPVGSRDEQEASLPVFWAGGGACAVDRRKFEALGGFDSLYHPFYVEDADISYQAWRRGWRCLMAPGSRVVHRHRGTAAPKFGESYVDNTLRRNQYLFIWKNVTDPGMLLQHIVRLPRIHARAILQHGGRFEIKAYLRAVARLPLALVRRLANVRAYVVTDRDVLGLTQ